MEHIVVIGAGQAGASLVAKLRMLKFIGKITLIGEEPVPPYQRPPLSKAYLLGDITQERLYLRPADYYHEQNITLRLNARVERVDTINHEVHVAGEVIAYDRLVFATGSTPRKLPTRIGGALAGVFTVRDLADVNAMASPINKGGHVLIVGGGYIGLEAAAVAARKGLKITLVEMNERILQRVACAETSAYFRALHKKNNVDLREGVGLDHLIGEEHVRSAKLTDGSTLDVDFVIVGVGIVPTDSLAKDAGLKIENGIRTDTFGQTSVPNIWAAGDCASFPWRGAQIRLESVQNAIDQAELVAENILGAQRAYDPKPWFWSDQYDIKLQIAGLNTSFDRIAVRNTDGGLSHWYYLGETLLAVDAMNDPRAFMVAKRLIEAGKSPAPNVISNPETELKDLLRA